MNVCNFRSLANLLIVEHNIPTASPPAQTRPRRPDLSTFFSTLELVDTSGETRTHHNANAVPIPGDISAAFRTLADAFERMRQDGGGDNGLLDSLVESLMADAEMPPREVKGVPDSYLDGRSSLQLRRGVMLGGREGNLVRINCMLNSMRPKG